jgi:PIN like domain
VKVVIDEKLSSALAKALNALFAADHEVVHIRDKFWPIPLLLDSGRTAPANVSFDAALLDATDAAAKERGLSRSAVLASAAREKIMASA